MEPQFPFTVPGGSPREAISEGEARFERLRATGGLFLGPAAFLLILAFPFALEAQAHRLAAILAWVVIYWVTEAIPLPATALLGPLLCVILGVAEMKAVFASFAHPIIFLFIGSFMIAQAMMVHGLDRRLATTLLSRPWVSRTPFRLMMVLGGFTALLSMWISNTAATVMVYPIVLGLLRGIPACGAGYTTGMLLMVAYGASIGGLGTLIGTPPNMLGVGLIREQIGVKISFAEWMLFGVPLMAAMLAVLVGLLYWLHRPTGRWNSAGGSTTAAPSRTPWSPGERNAAIVFGVAVVLWLFPAVLALTVGPDSPAALAYERRMPETAVAMLAALLLFLLPVNWAARTFTLTWRDAASINWGTILLFGGGLALGDLMFKTQLSQVIGSGLADFLRVESLWAVTGFAILLGIVMSELTSNTASATMVIPVVIAVAKAAGVDPLPPALGACLGASYGFMLPISTAPNAIIYGSGLVPIRRMVRAGILFDLAGFVIIWLGLWLLYPLLQGL